MIFEWHVFSGGSGVGSESSCDSSNNNLGGSIERKKGIDENEVDETSEASEKSSLSKRKTSQNSTSSRGSDSGDKYHHPGK